MTYYRNGPYYEERIEDPEPSVSELFSSLAEQASLLFRQEVQLAKVEMTTKVKELAKEVGFIVAGGLLAYAALFFLLATFVLALALVMPSWLAALIVTVVVGAIAAALISKGINDLKTASMKPEHTIASLQEDKEWLQRQVNS